MIYNNLFGGLAPFFNFTYYFFKGLVTKNRFSFLCVITKAFRKLFKKAHRVNHT